MYPKPALVYYFLLAGDFCRSLATVGVKYESAVKVRLYASALPSLLAMLILLLRCVLIHRPDWVGQQKNAFCK